MGDFACDTGTCMIQHVVRANDRESGTVRTVHTALRRGVVVVGREYDTRLGRECACVRAVPVLLLEQ